MGDRSYKVLVRRRAPKSMGGEVFVMLGEVTAPTPAYARLAAKRQFALLSREKLVVVSSFQWKED